MIKKARPGPGTSRRAEETVLAVLPRSVDVRRPAKKDRDCDLIVNGQPLEIKWVGEGSLGKVRRLLAGQHNNLPDIVVARVLSPGAREALSEEGVGWVDETGAAEIAVGAIVVSRTGTPASVIKKPVGWTKAVIAISEALLCNTKATVSAMVTATGLSTGSCTHALQVLTELDLLEAKAKRGPGSARQLPDPDRLLAAYAAAVEALPASISLQVGVSWRDPLLGLMETGKKWDKANIAWASTGTAAAAVTAPFLSSVTSTEVYIDANSVVGLEAVAIDVGLRPINGGRLILKPFPTVATQQLSHHVDGLRIAPWPRIYVDLLAAGVRGEEAAEHLKETYYARRNAS